MPCTLYNEHGAGNSFTFQMGWFGLDYNFRCGNAQETFTVILDLKVVNIFLKDFFSQLYNTVFHIKLSIEIIPVIWLFVVNYLNNSVLL